jgi:hypothetical protein
MANAEASVSFPKPQFLMVSLSNHEGRNIGPALVLRQAQDEGGRKR